MINLDEIPYCPKCEAQQMFDIFGHSIRPCPLCRMRAALDQYHKRIVDLEELVISLQTRLGEREA